MAAVRSSCRGATLTVVRPLSLKSIFGGKSKQPTEQNKIILDQDNLFHKLSQSPIAELRDRGAIINKYGVCPVCDTECQGHKKPPVFECPDCGYPTHCSSEHYHEGKAAHQEICGILREQNEDDHDLRSGRAMKEFEFPSAQGFDEAVNMANWDIFFYTRAFPSMDSSRSIRHVSKLLTYPVTVASVLHESCPYKLGKEITPEGMRSLAALRTILYPRDIAKENTAPARTEMINLYVIGARAEATLPPHIWLQMAYLFPHTPFHIHFVGPDALPANKEPHTTSLNERLMFTYDNSLYHDYHEKIEKFDPYTDLFFLFSPGIGHPSARETWKPSIQKALETKCAIFLTGFDHADMANDIEAVEQDYSGEFDWIMKPTENEFRSMKRDINLMDLRQTIFANWGIWGIRGKHYDVTHQPEDDE
ncbi:zinc-finger of mitochondrial splicing suppressor 51-domain-containing protein [Radiomyces spectabilis]|uniref:zinc-finger of mitochondrial splicing suppressor 51-domain-containing protein n=1 Tax=Radiomyces spectabilis TaxID=64574 RepID=UPI00221FA8A4|nr:zinc-finger of mitochondrial splicing suppressor 51-domain-containing protein [Radiomyces spectabilis]KAI8379252.1 zinc-finger of mitochondrial splicing suppressor 51-domain-containing protein [Radiomyces spectabilis]